MAKDIKFAERTKHIPRSFLRDIFSVISRPGMISFGGGFPNPDFLPNKEFARAAESVFAEKTKTLMQYGSTEGYEPLREFIAGQYKKKEGFDFSANDILITTGAQQGIDLVGRILLNDGDSIIVEDPTYLAAIQTFSAYQAKFLTVDLLEDGPNIDELKEILKKNKPKFFYTNPNFQNPSGITHLNEKRKQVAELLDKAGVIILEDDPYGEIRFDGERQDSYRTFSENVILLGSFSKTVAPGLRLGWISTDEQILEKLVVAKQATDLLSSNISQHLLYRYIKDNDTDAHLREIAENYKEQKDVMLKAIKKHLPSDASHTNPEGGMFIWLTLPGIDTRKLFELAVEEGVAFVPAESFYANESRNDRMRLNYTNSSPEQIDEGMQRLARAIEKYKTE